MEDLCRVIDYKGRSVIFLDFFGLQLNAGTEMIVDRALKFAIEGERQNHSMLIAIDLTHSDTRLVDRGVLRKLNTCLRPYVKRKAIVSAPRTHLRIMNFINYLRNSPTRFFFNRESAFAYLVS